MQRKTAVVVGLGQLGRIFAGGLLRTGFTVVPVNRGDALSPIAARVPTPALVLVAVAEPDLPAVLAALPVSWRTCCALLQNELLPRDWRTHGVERPTVAVVWFEKKKGADAKPILPSPVFGPAAEILCGALTAIGLPARGIADEETLIYELARKNLYILATNIGGLKTGGNVGQLWRGHSALARAVASEVLDIQDWLTGRKNDREHLLHGLAEAIDADPDHLCTGRSAAQRLARNLHFADEAGIKAPTLRAIQQAAAAH
ncbi:MAG TPA: hypothetical protein DEP05_05635 [Betaproteobacteria bacterium]|nr:hypothetical protein [Betaproteobacteria bacterium]